MSSITQNTEGKSMKANKKLLLILLSTALVLCAAGVTFALVGSQAGDEGSGIQTNPNAPGTKYEGPLTLYFSDGEDGSSDLNMFLRLRKGSTLYAFSGTASGVEVTLLTEIQCAVENFVEQTVIPLLYDDCTPCTPADCALGSEPDCELATCPTAWLKSVDQVTGDNELEFPGCCNEMVFGIMDVVIAVQD
jgi:hypothetical protein